MKPRQILYLYNVVVSVTFLVSVLVIFPGPARAEIFGNVHGIVHDPQHRPIQDATVDLKAQHSDYVQHQKTNGDGEFDFSAVPLGEYTVSATMANFQQMTQSLVVASGTSPVLHFQLELAGITEKTVVTGEPVSVRPLGDLALQRSLRHPHGRHSPDF